MSKGRTYTIDGTLAEFLEQAESELGLAESLGCLPELFDVHHPAAAHVQRLVVAVRVALDGVTSRNATVENAVLCALRGDAEETCKKMLRGEE